MEQQALATVERGQVQQQPQTLLQAVMQAARDPGVDVDKLRELVKLKLEIEREEARREFEAAKWRLQAKLPRIKKTGAIEIRGQIQSRYAPYEEIDSVIRPLLQEEGFSLSFDTDFQAQHMVMTGKLSHRLGHSETSKIILPVDSSGNKNGTQAIGSTTSYGRRYLVKMLLNVIELGDDDDGRGGSDVLTEGQVLDLNALLTERKANLPRFLKFANVERLEDILQRDYKRLVEAVQKLSR